MRFGAVASRYGVVIMPSMRTMIEALRQAGMGELLSNCRTALNHSDYRLAGGIMPFMRRYSTICP